MTTALRPATHARHYAEPPQRTDADGTRHWITRAANFLAVVSKAPADTHLARNNPDEYMVLLPPGTSAVAEAGGQRIDTDGNSLLIFPPGASRLTIKTAGTVVSVFSNKATDLAAAASNAANYADVRRR